MSTINRIIWTVGAVVWTFAYGLSGSSLDLTVTVMYVIVAAVYWYQWLAQKWEFFR